MSEPWNMTEAQRRQFREAQAEAKRTRPPSKPWRVYGPRGMSTDHKSQHAAYVRVKGLTKNLGTTAKVYHWEDGGWKFIEQVEPVRREI